MCCLGFLTRSSKTKPEVIKIRGDESNLKLTFSTSWSFLEPYLVVAENSSTKESHKVVLSKEMFNSFKLTALTYGNTPHRINDFLERITGGFLSKKMLCFIAEYCLDNEKILQLDKDEVTKLKDQLTRVRPELEKVPELTLGTTDGFGSFRTKGPMTPVI